MGVSSQKEIASFLHLVNNADVVSDRREVITNIEVNDNNNKENYMFEVSTEKKEIGKIIVLNAEGGIGKSSVMGSAVLNASKDGIVISVGEDGITGLKDPEQFADLTGINHMTTTIKKWAISPKEQLDYNAAMVQFNAGKLLDKDGEVVTEAPKEPEAGLLEAMRWLLGQNYKTIGIDSLTMIMPALKDYCLRAYFIDCPDAHGKGGTKTTEQLIEKAEGFGGSELLTAMSKEWNKLLTGFKYFREDKCADIWITTHNATKKGRIVGEELEYDYSFVKMDSNKNYDLGGDLFDMADAFLYGKRDMTIATTSKKGKGKAVGSGDRIFVTESNNVIKAKNRFGLPEEIPATWDALKEYLV